MHLAPLIRDLAVILGVAGLVSLIFERIRQPLVLGYIIAGIVIGPHTPPFQLVTDLPSIHTWAELGVIFLMFSLGLEFSFRKLARVGGSAALTAGAEVLFFLPAGYGVGRALGWNTTDSLFLGSMLSISSTTIIIKALDDLKLKTHRFAELIFAILIVEDLIAILLLVALSTGATGGGFSALTLLGSALKLVLVVGGWFLAGYFVVPRFMKHVGGNDELLIILSLGLCLTLVVFANHFNYSTALGAFIMGSILAETPLLHRIEAGVGSLKHVFGAVFFVSIGMLIDPGVLWAYKGTILLLCLFTVAGKIVSTSFGALLSGQSLKNSVQVGFGLAQIGEFSFIIAGLGTTLGVTSDFLYPIGVAVSLATTFTTPYFIQGSSRAAEALERFLPVRWVELLNRYAAHAEARSAGAEEKRKALRPLLRWLLNGLATSVLFVSCAEWLMPLLGRRLSFSEELLPLLGWGAAMLASSPFVWAMLTSLRVERERRATGPALRIFLKLVTLLWVGTLSAAFFPSKYVLLSTAAGLVLAFVLFYRRLEASYGWLEKHFLSTFEPHTGTATPAPFGHLAPWDAHLVHLELHPNAPLVLKSIRDAALRARFGVSIVAIRRGNVSLVTPKPEQVLLPRDELILLGTDEQVTRLRPELEAPAASAPDPETLGAETQYEVKQVRLAAASPLVGATIRSSGIRENHHALVVGLERSGRRTINPDSELKLLEGDVLWIAGDRQELLQLARVAASP